MEETQNGLHTSNIKDVYLINPLWSGIFFILGGIITVLIGMTFFMFTGLSAESDKLFALEALAGGLLADFILKKYAHRRLVVGPKLTIPLLWIWPLLCLYVFIFEPLT